MEEATANHQLLEQIITTLFLVGGLTTAWFCFMHHRKNPPVAKTLTATLVSRSWDTIQIAILLSALFLLYGLASFTGLLIYEEQIPVARLIVTLIIYSILMVIITLINRRRGGSWSARFGMGVANLRKLILAPVFYLAFIPFLMLAATGYHLVLETLSGSEVELQDVAKMVSGERSWLEIGYILMAILMAPFFEELLFRGIALPYFIKRGGLKGGIIAVSLLFSVMHFHLPSFLPLALLSVALCLVYWRTGSLWVSIGMHTIFNGVTILALNITG